MKIKFLLIPIFFTGLLSSCIQDEAPNAEADIEYCVIKDKSILKVQADTLFKANTDHNRIVIRVKDGVDLTRLAPEFILSNGATISPESGSEHDFSNDSKVMYTVTSEDRQWQKTYEVSFNVAEIATEYHFEHFELEKGKQKYYQWYEVLDDGSMQYDWATGNPGFKIAKGSAKPDEYPTVPYMVGVRGNAVKLETKDTGGWGALMNMRLAAGNLFMGSFDVTEAIKGDEGALRATNFGLPFAKRPETLRGWYKFKAGETFQDKNGNPVKDKRDVCDIYGVLYENTRIDEKGEEVSVVLNGNDVLSSPSIVALARINDVVESDDWTYFELPFVYRKEVDKMSLENYKYNLAIVFSSSIDGAYFEGALGSTLYIDEVSVGCYKD